MPAQILMCPPEFYGIEYEINAWMSRARPADRALAKQQWLDLKQLLASLGAEICLLDPQPGLPDLVFTANAALIYKRRAILARFKHPERQREEVVDAAWLEAFGLQIERLPEGEFFEGAGDGLFCGETLVAGYRQRSEARAQQHVAALVGCHMLPVELVDPHYYHLDTCFCPLAPGLAAWFPGAFDDYGQRVLREQIPELMEVASEEAHEFACNAVVVGKQVVTNIGCPRFHADLSARGFTPHATPLSEFVKSGGSAKCLTLRLDGEEAAGWRAG
jgi:N-dimethylarginine dimethylaminohydrolase